MVLSDFLDDNTHPMELIVIRDESNDSVEWRTITAVDQNGNRIEVPCHYIDI